MPKGIPPQAPATPSAIPTADTPKPSSGRGRHKWGEAEFCALKALVENALAQEDFIPSFVDVVRALEQSGITGWSPQAIAALYRRAKQSGLWEQIIAPGRNLRKSRIIQEIYDQYKDLHEKAMRVLADPDFLREKFSASQPDRIAAFLDHLKEALDQYGGLAPDHTHFQGKAMPNINVVLRVSDVEQKRRELEAIDAEKES